MAKRKATTQPARAGRRSKCSKTAAFVWKPQEWREKKKVTENVSILVSKTLPKQVVVKKVLEVTANSANDPRPFEIRALSFLPNCNRIVKPILYAPSEPDVDHGTAIFEHFPLGDVFDWRVAGFEEKNFKPVPESFIWRFFVQMVQALAVLQNQLGPQSDDREILIHRDIKATNVLVVDKGTTYPSFKLHDFDCALVYQRKKARRPARCGTFEYQPPENPIINTKAAEVWALGAVVHFIALGEPPIEDVGNYAIMQYAQHNRHPRDAAFYNPPSRIYAARVPRAVTPINLSQAEQVARGLAPYHSPMRPSYNHQYSDELNHWMTRCLARSPSRRPTVQRLMYDMFPVAKKMLRKMGGQAALADLEIKFES